MSEDCPHCGARESQVHCIWRNEDEREKKQPDLLACESCRRVVDPYLDVLGSMKKPSQRMLSEREIQNLDIGNQHSDSLSIIEWQCLKGAAEYYGVSNWMDIVDSQLTVDENRGLLRNHATENVGRLSSAP